VGADRICDGQFGTPNIRDAGAGKLALVRRRGSVRFAHPAGTNAATTITANGSFLQATESVARKAVDARAVAIATLRR
jgi:hypothetical protein